MFSTKCSVSNFLTRCEKGFDKTLKVFLFFLTRCQNCSTFFDKMRKKVQFYQQKAKNVSILLTNCEKCFVFSTKYGTFSTLRGQTVHSLHFKPQQAKISFVAESATLLLFVDLLCCFGFHKQIPKSLYCSKSLQNPQQYLWNTEQFVESTNN